MRPSSLALALAACAFVFTTSAEASPWTLQQGKVAMKVGFDLQFAGKEFLINGNYGSYPLEGRYSSANLRLQVRYGVTDRFEVGGGFSFSHINYESEEFVVPADDPNEPDSIASFDKSATGPADVNLYARFRFTPLGRAVAAVGLEAKLPTGYDKPTGTWLNDDPSQGIADDVSLGDGQMDLTPMFHAGFVPLDPWFIRADVGFRFRFFGPGHQVVGGLKTGVRIGDHVLPYASLDIEHTVNKGKVVGKTYTSNAPDKPVEEFNPDTDIEVLDFRLDRSALTPSAGVLILFKNWELDVGYRVVAWGINTGQIHSINVGVTIRP